MLNLNRNEMVTLLNLLNGVSGMEAARQLLPIYDKLIVSMRAMEMAAQRDGESNEALDLSGTDDSGAVGPVLNGNGGNYASGAAAQA